MREPGSEKKSKTNPDLSSIERREFLKTAGGATAGMATGVVLPSPVKNPYGGGPKRGDIVSIKDFGAVGDGITDDSAAFVAFDNAFQGQSVELLLPSGSYNTTAFHGNLFSGIPKIFVSGYGASLSGGGNLGIGPTGPIILLNGTASTALINSVASGSSTVDLVTVGDASKFTIGQWIMVAALDTEGFGYPPNPYYHEYALITNISGSTITLSKPLQNSYLSTYPSYNTGGPSDVNQGGPATIYALDPSFDTDVEVAGVHFPDLGFVAITGRKAKFIDCKFDGDPLASVNQQYIMERCSVATEIEVDKCLESATYKDCYLDGGILIPSGSVNRLTIDNCIIGGGGIFGTSRNTVIRNSYARSLSMGTAETSGISETVLIENCRIDSVGMPAVTRKLISFYSISNGTLSKPLSFGAIAWAVPGSKWTFYNSNESTNGNFYPPPFTVTNVRSDGTNTLIDTTLPSPLPTFTGAVQPDSLVLQPIPRITVINCSGCQQIIDLSNTAPDSPVFTYAHAVYTGNLLSRGVISPVNGYLVKIRVNVIRAYTGAAGSLVMKLGLFGTGYMTSAFVFTNWVNSFDLTVAGERDITPGSVVGLVGADTIPTIPVGAWMLSSNGVSFSADISGDTQGKWPIVEVEMFTNQGLVGIDVLQTGSNILL